MPSYDYYCDENDQTIEVVHSIDEILQYWAEVCYVAQIPLGKHRPARSSAKGDYHRTRDQHTHREQHPEERGLHQART